MYFKGLVKGYVKHIFPSLISSVIYSSGILFIHNYNSSYSSLSPPQKKSS